jgi:hypothetical protein
MEARAVIERPDCDLAEVKAVLLVLLDDMLNQGRGTPLDDAHAGIG